MLGPLSASSHFRHLQVFNPLKTSGSRGPRSALSRRFCFTFWLYMPSSHHPGVTSSVYNLNSGGGPCQPAWGLRLPAPSPLETFACTDSDAPLGVFCTIIFSLLTHVFRYDFLDWTSHLSPSASGSSSCTNIFHHSCRSLMTGAWELEHWVWGNKKFRRLLLALHSLCIRILDILLFEDILCIGT